MRRAEPWSDRAVGRVVHLVGRVTDEGFSFLGPATQGLAEAEATPPRHPVDLVESPVSAEFFAAARNEARRPLVVTGNHINNPRSAELFAQLAVLLGGEDLGLGFNWVGTVDHGSMVRLKAAQ